MVQGREGQEVVAWRGQWDPEDMGKGFRVGSLLKSWEVTREESQFLLPTLRSAEGGCAAVLPRALGSGPGPWDWRGAVGFTPSWARGAAETRCTSAVFLPGLQGPGHSLLLGVRAEQPLQEEKP